MTVSVSEWIKMAARRVTWSLYIAGLLEILALI